MRSSSACALSYSSRAAAPYCGWSRIAGKRPFSSHAAKKNVQSMYGTSSSSGTSTTRRPMNDGVGQRLRASSRSSAGWRSAVCVRQQRPLLPRAVLLAQRLLQSAVASRSNAPRCVVAQQARRRRRPRATRRARAPSAARTPARSSPPCAAGWSSRRRSAAAASMPRRSISLATYTISSSDGVIRPLRPIMSAFSSSAVCRILSHGTITPRSIDLVVVAAEHDADDVLADVVDVALDGRHARSCP